MIATREFLGIEETHSSTWRLPVVERVTGGGSRSLFGGVGLAAGIIALESASNRPVIWATGQYLARLGAPSFLDLNVAPLAIGHFVTQGRVSGIAGDREVVTVVGAAGRREGPFARTFTQCPVAPLPPECDPVLRHVDGASIHDHVELRQARGMFGFNGQGAPSGDGRTLLWARMPEIVLDAASIALMADYMASAVGNAISTTAHCTSLDNTIRFATGLKPGTSDWVLCDTHIDLVDGGLAHGSCRIWSEYGLLLAVASQSMTVSLPVLPSISSSQPVSETARRT